mgnify:CR=1 FL=1
MTPYTQITFEETYALALMRKKGHGEAAIARILTRRPSTVSRELRSNVRRCNGRGYVACRSGLSRRWRVRTGGD